MEHTKGPWKVKTGSDYTRIVSGKRWIAEMVEDENYSGDFIIPTVAEMQADAALIAAAPELLEKLKEITESFNMSRLVMDQESRGLAGDMVKEARALIAKSRGRSMTPQGEEQTGRSEPIDRRTLITLTSVIRQAYALIENGMEVRAKTLLGSTLDMIHRTQKPKVHEVRMGHCPVCGAYAGHPCVAFSRNPAPPTMKGFHKGRKPQEELHESK